MTNSEIEPENVEPETAPAETPAEEPVAAAAEDEELDEEVEKDERKRRLLLLLLLLLLMCLCCVCGIIFRYWLNPQPLPDMLLPTQAAVCYQPTYQFSITGLDNPEAIAVSPDDQRLYVGEFGGERLVKVFDRSGAMLFYFAPPGTDKANRELKYMAVSPVDGRVYVAERVTSSIQVYDADGLFLDAIIGKHLTLTKYMAAKGVSGTITHYEGINKIITYGSGSTLKVVIPSEEQPWAPLGLRFNSAGDLIYTDTATDLHTVNIVSAADLANLSAYNPTIKSFGTQGFEKDQFNFPQSAVQDAAGNYFVSDGNNSRIAIWTPDLAYKNFFGFGSASNGALNLPRGIWLGPRGCLHVADAVGSMIRVYNVSGEEPQLAFELGEFGIGEGQFNYPVDVYIDGTGRLYVADRANNRVQVWSY